MNGMTPNAANCAASQALLVECRWCGSVGVASLMRKWCGVPRTVFLHTECERVLLKQGGITETWYGEKRTTVDRIDELSARFYVERGSGQVTP
jgi:hypothetical protein